MKLLIGQGASIAWLAFPDNGDFVLAPRREMPIQAVVRNIDLIADKPLGKRLVPFEDLIPFFEPVKFAGNLGPESIRIFDRTSIDTIVIFAAFDMCRCAEVS